MKLSTLFKSKKKETSKEKFFVPNSPEVNFKFENDEHAILPLAECSCCGWLKPYSTLYVRQETEIFWSSMEADFIEESVSKMYCKNCVENI